MNIFQRLFSKKKKKIDVGYKKYAGNNSSYIRNNDDTPNPSIWSAPPLSDYDYAEIYQPLSTNDSNDSFGGFGGGDSGGGGATGSWDTDTSSSYDSGSSSYDSSSSSSDSSSSDYSPFNYKQCQKLNQVIHVSQSL